MRRIPRILALAFVLLPLASMRAQDAAAPDAQPQMPQYSPVRAHSGTYFSVGSTTVSNMLARWRTAFASYHPGVSIELLGGGSGDAPPALVSGRAALAPMSRPMNAAELASFTKRFGYEPTRITVAIDALAVYVNIDNPIESLTLAQADSIFSADRKRGGPPVRTWGDLGLTGAWAGRPVQIYGFRDTAGGYALFRELVMQNGAYRMDINVQPGSSSIVNAIGAYTGGVGYASQFFQTRRTRMVPIVDEHGVTHAPDRAACESGEYPLARELYIYINKDPDKPIDPWLHDFLSFILSEQGQRMAADDGNFPISAALALDERAKLGPAPASPTE